MEPKSASQANDDSLDDDADDLAGLMAGLDLSRKPCQVCQKPLTTSNMWKENVCIDCQDVFEAARKAAADPRTDLPPHSCKTRMIVKILQDIEARGEGEKTIIFSQFTTMLDLIEPFLRFEKIKFVRCECVDFIFVYRCRRRMVVDDGSMDKAKRDESLDTISNSKSTKVILISFKAGSTGAFLGHPDVV